MEQLILQINHSIDKANSEKSEMKVELDMCRVEKIKIDEKSHYLMQQYEQLKEQNLKMNEDFEH
tara:strand:+ start:846 stop:1037 length:192 start_codon:yes stop_codon:yes gene_type:complete